jgi:MFS family permease
MSLLKDHDFRKLWGGLTISKLGSAVASVVTPLLAVQALNAGALTVSLLTAAAWLPWLLIGLPAGAWVDRVAKRQVLLACDAAAALLVASVPLTAWLGHLTITHLLLVSLLTGVAAVFFEIAYTGYLPAMFQADQLIQANALANGSGSAAQIAGPALGGALAAAAGATTGLAIDAASFAASFVGLSLIRRQERPLHQSRPTPTVSEEAHPSPDGGTESRPSPGGSAGSRPSPDGSAGSRPSPTADDRAHRSPTLDDEVKPSPTDSGSSAPRRLAVRDRRRPGIPHRSIAREIRTGLTWLLHDRYLRNLMTHGAVSNLALNGYGAIIVVFLLRDVGVGTGTMGLLLSASGLGGVAAAAATPFLVRRFGAARALRTTKAAAGCASLLIPFTGPGAGLLPFVAGTALVAAFVVAGNVITGSFRQAYVPAALLGRVLTAMQFVNFGTIPVGALLGGVLATAYGNRFCVAVMTATYALAGLIILLGPFRGRRNLPAPDSCEALLTVR